MNSEIIIAKNIKIDKEYKNVLDYSESQMLQLLVDNQIARAYDYSFVPKYDNRVRVNFSYVQCLDADYLAFKNPNYGNKWYFAFIDSIYPNSESSCEITFTIDAWSTWFSYWLKKPCYVVREHVNDDSVGLHTVPESLETGEYICNEHVKDATMDSYAQDLRFIMASTSLPVTGDAKDTPSGSGKYNGIYTGLKYYGYDDVDAIDIMLEVFTKSGKLDAINGVFMAPKWLSPLSGGTYRDIEQSDNPNEFNISVSKQTSLNGYVPRNKKLLCYPYNYLIASNNIGQNSILQYEKFSGNNASFKVRGVLNPGCSINLTPINYNGNEYADNDAIGLGKFPICNYQNDMYTNWLTQNSVNILGRTITSDDLNIASAGVSSVTSVAGNIAVGNYAGAGLSAFGGATSLINGIMAQKQHNMIPSTISGQLNNADVNVASGNNTFHFYKMSVKREFAQIIDDYFTRYGYKIGRVKIPNTTGRKLFNYVEIGAGESIGFTNQNLSISVPSDAMDIINNIARSGVTIWHAHNSIGSFDGDNSIA